MKLKSTKYAFNFNYYGNSTMMSICIPKYSKVIDIDITGNEPHYYMNLYYLSDINSTDDKYVDITLIKVDDTLTLDQYMVGYEFIKTIDMSRLDVFSNGRSVTNTLLTDKYLVFINNNYTIDELRDDKINQIIE